MAGQHDRLVAAHDLKADHVEHLRHAGIDLARHDGRAGLHRRQTDLVQSGARSRCQQSQVVGDAAQVDRRTAQGRGERQERVHVLHGFEQVGAAGERKAGCQGKLLNHAADIRRFRVQTGSRRRTPDPQLQQFRNAGLQAVAVLLDGRGIGAELLPQADRHRILQMGPSRLENMVEFFRLCPQAVFQRFQLLQQRVQQFQRCQPDGGGDHVVGGLGHVDVIVGMQHRKLAPAMAQDFQGAVGQDLIDVHVVGRAGSGLEGVHHELIRQCPGQHLVGRRLDGAGKAGVQPSGGPVGPRGAPLDDDRGPDVGGVRPQAGDGKVAHGPRRLGSVVGIFRDFHLTQAVSFNPNGHYSLPRAYRLIQVIPKCSALSMSELRLLTC